MESSKRLFLLDAYALIFRAYYALSKMPRITSDGFNTSAIFGFVNTLEELLRKEKPSHIAVCFDPAGSTFRKEAYEAYKGERPATPEDIHKSVPFIKQIVEAYRIPVLEAEGFEADDVIGTMAKKAQKEGFTTFMMTPDKDFGQLVGPDIFQYKPSYKGKDFEIRGEEEICEKYGIQRTSQIIDLLALMGDKSDNIPGCPGVGEVTAVKLLREFGDVENLIRCTSQLKGALKKKVEENVDKIKFSKFLATIRTDVPIDITPAQLAIKTPDTKQLFDIFDRLEFRTLKARVEKRLGSVEKKSNEPASLFDDFDFSDSHDDKVADTPVDTASFKIVKNTEDLRRLSEAVMQTSQCSIFLVTDGDNDMTASWVASAIAISNTEAWLLTDSVKEAQGFILDLMARGDVMKITAGAKRDYVMAARKRTDDAAALVNYRDISLSHYLLQPEMRHDLPILASSYLHQTLPDRPLPKKTGNKLSQTPMADALRNDIASLQAYACSGACALWALHPLLEKEIDKENMRNLLENVELPLATVLADMELTGVKIDVDALNEAAASMKTRLNNLEKDIYELAGEEFNISSPARVGEILFDKLDLEPKPKKTKKGQYSTSEELLEKVAAKHPIVSRILHYRQLKKLLTTYLTALPAAINPTTGRIHTNYNQTVTATGRISSSNPNLQNIPVRDSEGRDIRRAFIVDKNSLFLSADYSQIELRLVADFSGDETMLDAFAHERDIHAATAAKIYHIPLDAVSDSQRRHAKTANFGILYGISAFGLASRLGIPRAEAKYLIDSYFEQFPKVKQYMEQSISHAREKGYVETHMGRKRRLPDINSRNPVVRGYAERNAINAPIQGFAADIIKKAMVDIFFKMKEKGLKSKMIMQVHDELNFEVPEQELPIMQEIVAEGMENAYKGRVRLTASCGVASNWLDAH